MSYDIEKSTRIAGQYMYNMCTSCARGVYGQRAPSEKYIETVGGFLFAVGAHESWGFQFSRQIGFNFKSSRGAHGFWQQESASIDDCKSRLDRHESLRLHAAQWYFDTVDPKERWYDDLCLTDILQHTCANPRLSCLWARLYLLMDPEPIPYYPEFWPVYWGRVYNRRPDYTKLSEFRKNYEKYVEPILAETKGR